MLFFAAMLAGHAAEPAAPELVDAIVEAYGGRQRLSEVHGYRLEGTIETARGLTGKVVRVVGLPDKLRVDLAYPDSPEKRLLIGDQGWRSGHGVMGEAKGPLLDSMVLPLGRAALPWDLDAHRAEATLIDPISVDGRSLPGLRFPLRDGLSVALWVDLDTHLIRKREASMSMPPMSFTAIYGDHREVDGVVFAFSEGTFAGETMTSTIHVQSVQLDLETEFAPPKRAPEGSSPLPPGHPAMDEPMPRG